LRRSGARTIPLLLSAAPIVTGADGTVGCVLTLVDISQRKAIEDALRRSEKLAAAGRIAGTLAHEINNPLSAVTNIIFLLQHNRSLDESAKYYVDMAASEIARVSHIVRNTLSFYREAAKPVPVRLVEILESVVEVYSRQIGEKQIHVDRRYDFDGEIDGFPGELRQVFCNLVGNAVDALGEGGRLTLHIARARNWETGATGVRVTVADRGPGIKKEHRPRLFEPFFTTKGEKGTGLGLWVTQGIVQKQGGSIRVRTSDNPQRCGTVFSVFINADHGASGAQTTHVALGVNQIAAGASADTAA
jgi:signal transduction histidine kinase